MPTNDSRQVYKDRRKIEDRRVTDCLTGLYSRTAFFRTVQKELACHPDKNYVIACWDIDRFKIYNNLYGSARGDEVIAALGDACQTMAKQDGCVCYAHFVSDSFLSCWEEEKFDAESFIRDVNCMLDECFGDYYATACFGFCLCSAEDLEVSTACDRARLALRTAKKDYDQHYKWYSREMYEKVVAEQAFAESIYKAIENGELQPWYQPQFNYNLSELIGAEALARWVHGDTMITPDVFIPVLEENGLIYQVDKIIWEQVCRQQREWMDQGISVLPVSINLSRRDVYHEDVIDVLNELLNRYNLDKNLLRLEITESACIDNPEYLVEVIARLRENGFNVEIDDFGRGFSSLYMLKDVEVDKLKLDLGFLRGANRKTGSILSSVVKMASDINLEVLAEGVETQKQADYLKSIGCTQMQGFLFSRPIPAEQYTWMLINHSHAPADFASFLPDYGNDSERNDFFSTEPAPGNRFIGGALLVQYDGHLLNLIRSNDSVCRLLGEDRKILESRPACLIERVPEEYHDTVFQALTRAKQTGSEQYFDIPVLKADGQQVWTHNRTRFLPPEKEGDNLYYIGVEDATAEHEHRDENEKVTRQIHSLIADISDGVADVRVDGEETTFISCSDGLGNLLGCTQEELLGIANDQPGVLIHQQDYFPLMDKARECISTLVPFVVNCRLRKKNGEFVPFEIRGFLDGIPGKGTLHLSFTVLSPGQLSATDPQENRDDSRTVQMESGIMLCKYLYADKSLNILKKYADAFDSVTYMSDACRQMADGGYIAQESIPDWKRLFEGVESGKSGTIPQLLIKGLHGGWRWYSASYAPVFRNGKIENAVICFRDITRKHNARKSRLKELDGFYKGLGGLYAFVMSCDLTENFCRVISQDRHNPDFSAPGSRYDAFLSGILPAIAPEDQEVFRKTFSRQSLQSAFSEGRENVCMTHKQLGPDGQTRVMETVVLSIRDNQMPENFALFMSRPVLFREEERIGT